MTSQFPFIETNAKILFNKGVSKTVASYTLKNIKDSAFCQDASNVLSSILKSLSLVSEIGKLFDEISRFDLTLKLLCSHPLCEGICVNSFLIVGGFLLFVDVTGIDEKNALDLFTEKGGLETIYAALKANRDNVKLFNLYYKLRKTLYQSNHLHT